MASAKKPSLADVAALPPEDDDMAMQDDDYMASADELADILGVPEEKREAFAEALQAFCMTCK